MNNKIQKECIKCGDIFYSSSLKTMYCSIRCARTKKFSLNDICKIIRLYDSGASARSIGNIFDCSTDTILNCLRRKGADIRDNSEANKLRGKLNRKFKVNDSYFEKIDSENKAYWLGFLVADGNISKSSNLLSVSLKRSDFGHLLKMRNDFESDHIINNFTNTTGSRMAGIYITSQKIKHDLSKLGVVPNKRYNVKAPLIDHKLYRHFWRGMIDGDGSIFMRKRKNTEEWTIKLTGTYDIVKSFSDFIRSEINVRDRKIHRDGKSFFVSYQGTLTPISVIRLLYENSAVHLDRKMELANDIIKGIK